MGEGKKRLRGMEVSTKVKRGGVDAPWGGILEIKKRSTRLGGGDGLRGWQRKNLLEGCAQGGKKGKKLNLTFWGSSPKGKGSYGSVDGRSSQSPSLEKRGNLPAGPAKKEGAGITKKKGRGGWARRKIILERSPQRRWQDEEVQGGVKARFF